MTFQDEFRKLEQEYEAGEWKKERKQLKEALLSRPVILYGLGFFGGVLVKNFSKEGIPVKYFCDGKKRGVDSETGLSILSPQELAEKHADASIVISVANPSTEQAVYETILTLGFDKKQIFRFKDAYQFMHQSRVEQVSMELEEFRRYLEGYERAYSLFQDNTSRRIILETIENYLFHRTFEYESPKDAYFPRQFQFGEREVFIDGGLYTGDTTEAFIKRVNGTYSRIIGFDIDANNLKEAYKTIGNAPGVEIVSKGLWDCAGTMTAELGIMAGSNIKEGGTDTVELVSLDEVFADVSIEDYPTFIKLDVEGAEQQALLGAKKILNKAMPKLAVCAYHKPEDLYALPELIREINPDYRFFMKHYSPYIWDTVLYAY